MTEPVTVERDGHVLLIGVNRPAKRNAFNLAAIDALGSAYEILGGDDELRAGVLFAHGDHFSAGLDLAEVGPAVAGHGPQVLCGSHRFDPFGVWGDPVPKPVVMAVSGIAFTLSIELALAADIVIAAEDVRFRQLEIGRGIMPFGGATFRAPAQLGWGNAMRFLLTAEEFGAAEALRIGLVQEVVPAGAHVHAGHRTGAAYRPAGPAGRAGDAGQRPCRARPWPGCGARVSRLAATGHLAQPGRRRRAAQLHRTARGTLHRPLTGLPAGDAARSVKGQQCPHWWLRRSASRAATGSATSAKSLGSVDGVRQ